MSENSSLSLSAKPSPNERVLCIGILATGNEVVEGETANTNASDMSAILTNHGISVRYHLAVTDDEEDIRTGFRFLIDRVDCIICIGGLGPTSDDRTRFALANEMGETLFLNDKAWKHIEDRLNRMKIVIHESNRQQALFPKEVMILENLNGTACGARLDFKSKIIYMLPGPPKECLPIFNHDVLPQLINAGFCTQRKIIYWRLIGVVEANIAAMLDEVAAKYDLETGYRVSYPYLEFKLIGKQSQFNADIVKQFNELLLPHFVTQANTTATRIFNQQADYLPCPLYLIDTATQGALYPKLIKPSTLNKIKQTTADEVVGHGLILSIAGLEKFWSGSPFEGQEKVNVQIEYAHQIHSFSMLIPFRDQSVITYACEFAAAMLLKVLGETIVEFRQCLPEL